MAYPFPFVAGNILTAAELNALENTLPQLGFQTGQYYGMSIITEATSALTANRSYYMPFFVSKQTTFDRIAVRTGAGFVGTATTRLGIYNNDTTTGNPSTVNLDAGTVSCTAATSLYQITISKTLAAGWYWTVVNTQTAAATNNFEQKQYSFSPFAEKKVATTMDEISSYYQNSVTGAFATAGTLVNNNYIAPPAYLRAV